MRSYIVPISDRDALSWIVREERTAFPRHRERDAKALDRGDRLFLYTTRGCFRNPTRDRGRVVAEATVRATARELRPPIAFGGREFPWLVTVDLDSLAPFREGVELRPLVPRMPATFPDPASWSARMRRAIVPVEHFEAEVIATALRGASSDPEHAIRSYPILHAERR